MKRSYLYFVCFLFVLASCNSNNTADEKLLDEAKNLYLDALSIEKDAQVVLDQLDQMSIQLNIQGRELTAEEINFIDLVSDLHQRYDYWEENHIEVPGIEHSHEHGHDHHQGHDHSSSVELLPVDMLTVQQEFRDSIIAIKADAELALKSNQ
ncbi:MAG: hypothetical protein AAFO07_21715 [Bacteroidota bacterium]